MLEFDSKNHNLKPVIIFVVSLVSIFSVIIWSVLGRPPAPQTILYKWVQLVPDDGCRGKGSNSCKPRALVRFIVKQGESCPALYYDNGPEPVVGITRRQNPTPDTFPVEVCQVLLPDRAATSIRFPDGNALAVPKRGPEEYFSPNRIVILGDTGCRGRNKDKDELNQPCENPVEWPFDKVAKSALKNLSTDGKAVDLVMHVGDYVYGEFYGRDHWELWKKEFFEPAKALLGAAPWIFTRGNHEICFSNSANGWFLFLDYPESPRTRKCNLEGFAITTKPYALDLNNDLRVVIMDTANAHPDARPKKKIGEEYSRQFKKDLPALTANNNEANKKVWILTHVPFRGLEQSEETTCKDENTAECNARFIPAPTKFLWPMVADTPLKENVKAVIAGDRHDFQLVKVESDNKMESDNKVESNNNIPVQLTFGHGGVKLDPDITASNPMKVKLPDSNKEETWLWKKINEFGYAIAVRKGNSWTFQVWTAEDNKNSIYRYKCYYTPDKTDKTDKKKNKPCIPK